VMVMVCRWIMEGPHWRPVGGSCYNHPGDWRWCPEHGHGGGEEEGPRRQIDLGLREVGNGEANALGTALNVGDYGFCGLDTLESCFQHNGSLYQHPPFLWWWCMGSEMSKLDLRGLPDLGPPRAIIPALQVRSSSLSVHPGQTPRN